MRRRLRHADWLLLAALLGLTLVGVLVIYSTTHDTPREGLFPRHLVSIGIGLAAFGVASVVPYRYLEHFAIPAYVAAILLLVLVAIMGTMGFGAQRWLALGPIKFQPSEVAKIATLLVIARYLAGKRVDPTRPSVVFRVVGLVLIPMALVLQQPDLGTALAFAALLTVVLFWAGTPLSWLLFLGALGANGLLTFRLPPIGVAESAVSGTVTTGGELALLLTVWGLFLLAVGVVMTLRGSTRRMLVATLVIHVAGGLVAPHAWNQLEEYQRNRILTFLNPGRDPSGAGYQVIQAKIAAGSGGVTGKGYLKGTQKALAYLPQQHTDFVFSVVGEEFGFVGSVGVMGLFLLLLYRGVRIARQARDRFASLVAIGVVGVLAYHVFVNLFMTMGLAPVTGLPLPFISYGGSFLTVTMILIGVLEGVAMRRHAF
jgi:rod shape determining protein RodA